MESFFSLQNRPGEDHAAIQVAAFDGFIFAGGQDQRVCLLSGDGRKCAAVIRFQQFIGVYTEQPHGAVRGIHGDQIVFIKRAQQAKGP